MHLVLSAEDSEAELRAEMAQSFAGAALRTVGPRLHEISLDIGAEKRLPGLVFARQLLPHSKAAGAESIREWAAELFRAVVEKVPADRPWRLHVEPHYGARAAHRIGARAWHSLQRTRSEAWPGRSLAPGGGDARRGGPSPQAAEPRVSAEAGQHRCRLIRDALREELRKKRRQWLRQLRDETGPFTRDDSLVQLLLTSPGTGFVSVAPAPLPFTQRHWLSPFPKGDLPVASDPEAPSRAFAKLVEAEQRLGRSIRTGETCVDLGAAPGSWTYVAARRGAPVLAVDRAPLREDLIRHPLVRFAPGDAFQFTPARPVDWLLCDVIAAPERTAALLLDWLRRGWCRHFVVTLKLKDDPASAVLGSLKTALPGLTAEWFLTRLCANKKEVCAFG